MHILSINTVEISICNIDILYNIIISSGPFRKKTCFLTYQSNCKAIPSPFSNKSFTYQFTYLKFPRTSISRHNASTIGKFISAFPIPTIMATPPALVAYKRKIFGKSKNQKIYFQLKQTLYNL